MCVQTVARLKEASGWSIVGHEQGFERTKTILLVEDEPFVREVTGEVLRAAGYRVLTAKNAKEGSKPLRGAEWRSGVIGDRHNIAGRDGASASGKATARGSHAQGVVCQRIFGADGCVRDNAGRVLRETVFQRSAAANREGIIGVRGDAEGDGRTTYARLR